MKVILYMAQSLNGVIARDDYSEDFLSHENWKVFLGLAKDIGCFVIGRKTYQIVKKWKGYNFDNVKSAKIVTSKDPRLKLDEGYRLARSPIEAIMEAKKMGFKKILLTGGSAINTAFIKQNLIDEIILDIEPYVIGKGIRLFKEEEFENKLKLIKVKKMKHGIIQLRYKVTNKSLLN